LWSGVEYKEFSVKGCVSHFEIREVGFC